MAAGITATVAAALMQLLVPQYLGQAVDQAQGLLAGAVSGRPTGPPPRRRCGPPRGSCCWWRWPRPGDDGPKLSGEAVGHLIGFDLRMAYYRQLQRLSLSWHDRVHTGDLMTRGILDIEGVRLWTDTGILRMFYLGILIGGGAIRVAGHRPGAGSGGPRLCADCRRARLVRAPETARHLARPPGPHVGADQNHGRKPRRYPVVRAFAAQDHEMAKFDQVSAAALETAAAGAPLRAVDHPDDLRLFPGDGRDPVGGRRKGSVRHHHPRPVDRGAGLHADPANAGAADRLDDQLHRPRFDLRGACSMCWT